MAKTRHGTDGMMVLFAFTRQEDGGFRYFQRKLLLT